VTPESVTGGVTVVMGVRLTEADKLFEADRPGWYIFDKRIWKRICWKCGLGFETHLELGKFCSPGCKDGYLVEAFRGIGKSLGARRSVWE